MFLTNLAGRITCSLKTIRIIVRVGRVFAILMATLIIILIAVVLPVDRTEFKARGSYARMQENLGVLDSLQFREPLHSIHIGYSVINITPSVETAIAGSGLRKARYTAVHDSLFVRTLVASNGAQSVAVVVLDMLLVPPTLREKIELQLPSIGFRPEEVYFAATHTHSSLGNWGEHLVGYLYSGSYDPDLIDFLTQRVMQSIADARSKSLPASLRMGSVPVPGLLFNRVADEKGGLDSLMHVIEITRSDGSSAIMASFTGHATCMPGKGTELSRDYPGVVVDRLEASGYDFAMFMAGAVGSHGCRRLGQGSANADSVGTYVTDRLLRGLGSLQASADSVLACGRVPLALDEPQFKIAKNWRLRPWIFRWLVGEYPVFLSALRMGDQVMLGTPCDFSGELTAPLYASAHDKNLHVMVTSFNGGYVGYITKDAYYDYDHYETRLMNWYGPWNGAYFTSCLLDVQEAFSK